MRRGSTLRSGVRSSWSTATDVDTDGKPLVTKRARFAAERVEFLVENS